MSGKAATLLDGIEAITAAHPTRIMLEALDDATLRRLATAPMGDTRRLGAVNIKEAMVHGFLGQNLSRVETLYLTGSFGDKGAIQVAQESHLSALKRLLIGPANIKNAGLRAIASSTVLSNLEELHIGDARFNKATTEELVHSSALAKLKILFVGGKRVDLPR